MVWWIGLEGDVAECGVVECGVEWIGEECEVMWLCGWSAVWWGVVVEWCGGEVSWTVVW